MQAPISRARYTQENRKMRFEEVYQGWTGGRLTQACGHWNQDRDKFHKQTGPLSTVRKWYSPF